MPKGTPLNPCFLALQIIHKPRIMWEMHVWKLMAVGLECEVSACHNYRINIKLFWCIPHLCWKQLWT